MNLKTFYRKNQTLLAVCVWTMWLYGLVIWYILPAFNRPSEPTCVIHKTVIEVCDECLRQVKLNQKNVYLMCAPQIPLDAK